MADDDDVETPDDDNPDNELLLREFVHAIVRVAAAFYPRKDLRISDKVRTLKF